MERNDKNQDELPQIGKDLRIAITDTQLALSLKAISDEYKLDPLDLTKKFLKLGLILKKAEMSKVDTITVRDKAGFESNASEVFNDILTSENSDPGIKVRKSFRIPFINLILVRNYKGLVEGTIPTTFANELMEFANIHHTSVENIFAGILKFGLKALKEDYSFVYKDSDGKDQHFSIF